MGLLSTPWDSKGFLVFVGAPGISWGVLGSPEDSWGLHATLGVSWGLHGTPHGSQDFLRTPENY